jgi:DNA-binding transcriptional LysR family regulator
VLALVAAGQGVALVPQLALVAVPPGVTLTGVPICRRTRIAFRSGSERHPTVAALSATLRAAASTSLGTGG